MMMLMPDADNECGNPNDVRTFCECGVMSETEQSVVASGLFFDCRVFEYGEIALLELVGDLPHLGSVNVSSTAAKSLLLPNEQLSAAEWALRPVQFEL
ncbi:MAG: hypothetical protein NPIRA05_19710 [Nitrospirales bacterium]|nr:MAG: hypothetical protein NPIRA05_19710 [Nitrospirales bacterium]